MCLQNFDFSMTIKFLDLKQVNAQYADELHEAVRRVVDSGWYLQGKENEQFERNFAEYIGTKHCVGCANGLDALIWIYRAYIELGVMLPGDESTLSVHSVWMESMMMSSGCTAFTCAKICSRFVSQRMNKLGLGVRGEGLGLFVPSSLLLTSNLSPLTSNLSPLTPTSLSARILSCEALSSPLT